MPKHADSLNVKAHYVMVLPCGKELACAIFRNNAERTRSELRNMAAAFVQREGPATSAKEPRNIDVDVFSLDIVGSVIRRTPFATFSLPLPIARMTDDEFADAVAAATRDLPREFAGFVSHKAWEYGHSSGYEEVVSIAKDLASDLVPAVKAYLKRLAH